MALPELQIQETIFMLLRNIAPEANLSALKENENLREKLGIDSFDFLNLMIGINENLGVEIPETDYGKLVTLNEIIHYIANHTKT
jgi:acyl carrier protein